MPQQSQRRKRARSWQLSHAATHTPCLPVTTPRVASTRPQRAQRLPCPCPCPGWAAARGPAAGMELRAGQGTQPTPEPRRHRSQGDTGAKAPASPAARGAGPSPALLRSWERSPLLSSSTSARSKGRAAAPIPESSTKVIPCKTSQTSRRVTFGLPRAALPQSSSGGSAASPAPSKAISKPLSRSRRLQRCAPAAGRAQHVRSRAAEHRLPARSHASAFPRPAIFRLSLRCLRCFADSGRAPLPDDVKRMQFSQLQSLV